MSNTKESSGPRNSKRRRRRRKGGDGGGGQTPQPPTDQAPVPSKRDPKRPTEHSPDVFFTDRTFRDLNLSEPLLKSIDKHGFVHPTKVQGELIPLALTGCDVLGQSKTGTGKTAAFGLPILERLSEADEFGALVLVPTRELAIQVSHEMRELARFTDFHILPVYGGQRMNIQMEKLRKNPQIIVGTPGRIMDMHGRGYLPYDKVKIAVLDEVDRMLDIGFRDDIRKILGVMKQPHQTIFVSATISEEIERLARQYMKNPKRLELTTSKSLTVEQVNQRYFSVQPWDKNHLLLHLLTHQEPALTLVFCRMKQTCDALVRYLNKKGVEAHALHADLHQGKRNQVMQKLREGQLSVLVASDLAARGLDVDDITHVINYDLPEDPDVYVHRIGRTARAGRDGVAWTFVSPEQGQLLTAIEMLTNVEIPEADFGDFKPGPVPPDVAARAELTASREKEAREKGKRTQAVAPPAGKVDDQKFPGGIVPIAAPAKRMGGKVRRRR
jgi:ATP-dependent RNA helicase DeaD